MEVLALDVGGTNIRSGLVSGKRIKEYRKIKTLKKKKEILNQIFEIVSLYGKQKVICLAIPGFERRGIVQESLNLDINGVSLSGILRKKFMAKIFIENDANCAGLAEMNYGIGKGVKNFVLLTLGTGIGGCAICDGELYRGRGGAIEPGSMVIDSGKIFEELASGSASVNLGRKNIGRNLTSRELEMMAKRGNKKALSVYAEVGNYLGIGLSNLAYIFDPELLILGGGFSKVKYIYKPARKSFNEFYKITPKPKIVKAKFGDDAGLIGAGALWRS